METGFLYRNGEVSLKDLEIWYDHGLVTPEDRITICETNRERSIFKISTLINLYGSEAPFKLIPLKPLPTPRSISSAPKKAPPPKTSGPTEPLKAEADSPVCPRIIENDKFQSSAPKEMGTSGPADTQKYEGTPVILPKILEFSNVKYMDYPLFNVLAEPADRRITGKEIYEAMKDLEMIYNQLPRSYIIEKFDFLKRRNFANGSFSTAICRLCNQTPYGIELFFNHLFSEGHIKLLCHFSISMQSIFWWMDQFQNRPQAIPVQIPVIETPKRVVEVLETPPIPLFYSNTSNDIRKLSTFDISQFGFHFAQLQWKYGIYLERRFSKIRIPDFCNLCQEKVVPNHFGMTSHIFSNRHLNGLTGISKSDLNFWNNYFKLEVEMEQVPIDVKKRILNFRNPTPIPLVDFNLEATLVPESQRFQQFDDLKNLFYSSNQNAVNEKLLDLLGYSNPYCKRSARCFLCFRAEKDIDGDFNIAKHVFSDHHRSSLIQLGFSQEMVDWWKTLFRDVRDYRSSESRNRRTSKVQKASEVSKNRQNSRQRIPLIDPPLPGQQLASMEEIQTILNESYAKFINAGQRITVAKKALVSWNCTFCSDCTKNITLSNEMDTFLHIVKVNHQKKMNGQATRSDLLYWKEWVDRWDAETTVTAQCLIEPTEVPQNVHEANGYIRSVNYLSTVRTGSF
ncbi:hypothetical protein L5515_000086 [Caenorhabditis briggsae]|uniref:Uncharacterized protein n=3 Tax=Caenorhabditis briggsae TaxID=6238 RepID=A0AAE9E1D3_CAEBR|nr:hypothetical protein L5515_000086 [Caenorhabditis briggsae]